jgi:hypothetical protein
VGIVYPFVSVRLDAVLTKREREVVSQTITSLGGLISSWRALPKVEREYALLDLPRGTDARESAERLRAGGLRAHADLLVLEIIPPHGCRLEALLRALTGPGGPRGVLEATRSLDSVVVELDASVTPLCLLVDLIDVELEQTPGRRILPLFPLDDATLTAFARDRLADPRIDVSRLIETYTAPLLDTVEEA